MAFVSVKYLIIYNQITSPFANPKSQLVVKVSTKVILNV